MAIKLTKAINKGKTEVQLTPVLLTATGYFSPMASCGQAWLLLAETKVQQ